MIARFASSFVLCALVVLSGATSGARASTTASDTGVYARSCGYDSGVNFQASGRRTSEYSLVYPNAQITTLGEGWISIAYTITPAGTAINIRAIDAIGDKSFVEEAIAKIREGHYEPAVVGGQPVERHDLHFDTQFKIDMNRGAVHRAFDEAFAASHRYRNAGRPEDAVKIVKPVTKFSLTLYEQTTLAHGLAIAYVQMKDYRRALIQIRHAVIGGEKLLVFGSRAYALALQAELEARNNNFAAAMCAFDTLRIKYKDFEPSPELLSLTGTANAMLLGNDLVRTEVEIVESDREDVPNLWTHALLRRSFRFTNIQGAAPKYRLVCPLALIEGEVREGAGQAIDPAKGRCSLEVWGEVGAKFVLEEK